MSRRSPGRGSIIRRADGKWCGALQVNGKRRYVYGTTRSEVAAKLDKSKQAAVGNCLPDPGKRTVNDLLDAWLGRAAVTLKPRTLADYKAICERYLRPQIGAVRLSKLAPEHVEALYDTLQRAGTRRAPSHAHAVLHRAFEVAVLWRWLPQNPCDRVLKPSYDAPRKEIWNQDELLRFLDATTNDWLHPLWIIATATGCRLGELLALRWEDVDWDRGVITVRRNVQRIERQRVFSEPKTKAGERTVSLPANVVAALRQQKAQQAERKLRMGQGWKDTGFVFTAMSGGLMDHGTPEHAMQRVCEQVGLPRLTPHGLRHLAASLLLDKGLPVTAVSARLGHTSPSITMAIYAHAMKHQDQQAADIMEGVLQC